METPTRKGGVLPLHGAHTAFSCYPALRLYRLSKSQRGIDVVSLTLGNSDLPLAYGLCAHVEGFCQLFLRHAFCKAQRFDLAANVDIHKGKTPFPIKCGRP